jgi:hypothetical protein
MAYCTVSDVARILPEKVTIGSQNIGVSNPSIQGSQRSNISPEEAMRYIEYASSFLDARLRPFYACPLRRTKSYETMLTASIVAGINVVVTVEDSGAFIRGQLVRLQDKDNMETAIVTTIPLLTDVSNINNLTLDAVHYSFSTINNAKISVLEYPDPVPLITAQMAASLILDRIFVSQNSPDVSAFGVTQRNLAKAQIDNILSGEILLFGQEMTGRRFVRGSVFDAYKSPAEIQKGTDKE